MKRWLVLLACLVVTFSTRAFADTDVRFDIALHGSLGIGDSGIFASDKNGLRILNYGAKLYLDTIFVAEDSDVYGGAIGFTFGFNQIEQTLKYGLYISEQQMENYTSSDELLGYTQPVVPLQVLNTGLMVRFYPVNNVSIGVGAQLNFIVNKSSYMYTESLYTAVDGMGGILTSTTNVEGDTIYKLDYEWLTDTGSDEIYDDYLAYLTNQYNSFWDIYNTGTTSANGYNEDAWSAYWNKYHTDGTDSIGSILDGYEETSDGYAKWYSANQTSANALKALYDNAVAQATEDQSKGALDDFNDTLASTSSVYYGFYGSELYSQSGYMSFTDTVVELVGSGSVPSAGFFSDYSTSLMNPLFANVIPEIMVEVIATRFFGNFGLDFGVTGSAFLYNTLDDQLTVMFSARASVGFRYRFNPY